MAQAKIAQLPESRFALVLATPHVNQHHPRKHSGHAVAHRTHGPRGLEIPLPAEASARAKQVRADLLAGLSPSEAASHAHLSDIAPHLGS